MFPPPSLRSLAAGLLLAAAGGALPPRLGAATPGDKPSFVYALAVSDQVRIDVVGQPDLSTLQKIDALGNVNLAYVGNVHIAGLTRDQAQKAIETAYIDGQYLRHPQATVTIEQYAERVVSIQGQVKNSGQYVLPDETTYSVVELVTKAGGFTDIAKGTDVIITHSTADGKKEVRHVDVQDIIKGKGTLKPNDPRLLLQPGDIVFVPEKII